MQVKCYKPQTPLLQKHIDCIYTLKRGEQDEKVRYIAFPSMFAMVCLNTNCEIERRDKNLRFSGSQAYPLRSVIVCDYGHSSVVEYEGPTDEIVIYFKPLALSAFLDQPFRCYTDACYTDFSPFSDYMSSMAEVFAIGSDDKRLRMIESYWISKFRGFEHPFMHAVVSDILEDAGSFSIAEAAKKYNVSRTTLIKHFDLHLATTPSQFRKVIRFRNAMKHQRTFGNNLTDISHGVDYFDQSHMVKDFRALTKYSPKNFFSQLSVIEDGKINWLFLPSA